LQKLVHGTQTAALIVTHNERLASQMDRVLRIEKGQLVAEG
jgi:lipoprotein-releasing system ATP-binding protein